MMVYLAPHHDDILLSRPAALLQESGSETHVIICFSEESNTLQRHCSGLHRELGIRTYPLGLAEAVRRGVPIRTCLRPGRSVGEVAGDSMVPTLYRGIHDRLRDLGTQAVCAPLLPIHLDHALVRRAAECMPGLELSYYEDQPYSVLFPGRLRDETSGMTCRTGAIAIPVERIERLLRRLEHFLSTRDVSRILHRYGSIGRAEPLWRGAPQ